MKKGKTREMKKVLILEDHAGTRKALECTVRKVDASAEIYAMGTTEEAYSIAMSNTIDMFILDIILKPGAKYRDSSGADFAQNIRMVSRYRFTPIIFLTSLYDSKMNMYSSIHCFRFIEKPCDYDVVEDVIREAIQYHTKNGKDRQYFYRNDGVLEAVMIRDIIYVQSYGSSVKAVTTREEAIIPYKSLRQVQKELDVEDFLQCNRTTIVNKEFIKTVDATNRFVNLYDCDDVLEIGSVLKKPFLQGLGIRRDE